MTAGVLLRPQRTAPSVAGVPLSVRAGVVTAIILLPALRPAGPGNTGIADVGLLAAVITFGSWAWQTRRPVAVPYLLGMGLMIVAGLLAAWRAGSGTSALAVVQDVFLLSWGATVTGVALAGASARRLLVVTFCRSGVGWAAVLVVADLLHINAVAGITERDGARAALTFNDPNLAADYFVLVLFLCAASSAFRRTGSKVGAVLVLLTAIVLTGSNGAGIGILVGTCVAIVVGIRRNRGIVPAVAVGLLLGVLTAWVAPRVSLQALAEGPLASVQIVHDSIGRTDESTGSRTDLWTEEAELLRTHDLLGIGPGRTETVLRMSGAPYVKEAHTDYLATVVERGALGTLGLLILCCTIGAVATRVVGASPPRSWRASPPRPREPDIVPRPEFLVAGLIALAIAALFYETLHFRHVWFFLGLLAGLDPNRRFDAVRRPLRTALERASTAPAPGRTGRNVAGRQWRLLLHPALRQPPAQRRGRHLSIRPPARGPGGHHGVGVPHHRKPRRFGLPSGTAVLENAGARVVAIVSLTLATVVVARAGGPSAVGTLALLRVLPGLFGVVAACGLPSAVAYFAAGADRAHAKLWSTIVGVLLGGALVGTVAWLALVPLIQPILFPKESLTLVAVAGITVATQLPVAVGKGALQGLEDLRASNLVTAAEEAAFLPAIAIAYVLGLRGAWLLVAALLAADVAVGAGAWMRVRSRVHARGMHWGRRPDVALGKRITAFGTRSQVGGILLLLNLRLDFIILGALTSAAAVGVYGVASKYAELLRLPALALLWVGYPQAARQGATVFAASARRQLRWLLPAGAVGAALLALLAIPLLPLVYGRDFAAAGGPAVVLVIGLVLQPAAALGSAYLMGSGRPGRNSLLVGAGFVVTVALDLALIPGFGVMGAAWASTVAYLTTDLCLVVLLLRANHRRAPQIAALGEGEVS